MCVHLFHPDECSELARSSLWSVDVDWSEQAQALREIALHNPQLFSVEYGRETITQLRIIGKQVDSTSLSLACTCDRLY